MRPCLESRISDPAQLLAELSHLAVHATSKLRTVKRLQAIYARRDDDGDLELIYIGSEAELQPFRIWRYHPVNGVAPSLAKLIPLAGSYEREIQDLYGVTFAGAPDGRRLVLHQGIYPPGAPLSPAEHGQDPPPSAREDVPAPFFEGRDIQRLGYGPVRSDVVESGRFNFWYAGEGIVHLDAKLFYKHRAMETRFEGKGIGEAAVLSERISGVDSVAHALAFSTACENAIGIEAPPRANQLRVVLAELERLYNHLHYFGLIAKLTTLKVADAEGHYLEELAKQLNARFSGSRFLRNLVTVGGLRRDLDTGQISDSLVELERKVQRYLEALARTRSYIDRLETTGVLDPLTALAQGATGPVERASGLNRDLRRDHPYASYEQYEFMVPEAEVGDARARASIREAEIFESISIILQACAHLDGGPIRSPLPDQRSGESTEGLGWVEATRGTLIYAVHLDGSTLTRVKVKDPSFSNWRAFPFTVTGSNMMDYAISEASFGLSIAGNDR